MPDTNLGELTFTVEALTMSLDEACGDLDTEDESPVVAYVNGKFYPILSLESDKEEGRLVLNIGTKEVPNES